MHLLFKEKDEVFMNKNLGTTNEIKMKDYCAKRGDNDVIKTQNDQLNLLLQEHYASPNSKTCSLIDRHDIPKKWRSKPEDKYEYEYCKSKNEFEELIKNYWEDIISDVLSTTENKFKRDYFTSNDKEDIPKGMCALKIEYQAYKNFKTSKSCDDYKFAEEWDGVYIVDYVELDEDYYYYYKDDEIEYIYDRYTGERIPVDNNRYRIVRRALYNKIEDKKHDIAIDVRKEKMSRLSDLRKFGYDENYVLYSETLVSFLKTLSRNDINDPEKRKMFLEFLQSDKLKIKTFDSEVISEIIDLVYFGRYTNINEWFDFLSLNKEHDLSPSVLFKCARKAQVSAKFSEIDYYSDEYIEKLNKFGTEYINEPDEQDKEWWIRRGDLELNADNIYRPKLSHEYYYRELNYKFNRWKADDVKEVLSFAINYKWPDPATNQQDYDQEVNCFLGLLMCLFDNLTSGRKLFIQTAKEVFDFVNKNMCSAQLSINEIERYENGKQLLETLKKSFVSIVPGEQNGGIEIKIDYYGWFNDFVRDKFHNDQNIEYNSLDELSKARENLIAEFIKYVKEAGIDISADVAKTLSFDANFVDDVLKWYRIKSDIVKTPENFKRYVSIINEMMHNKPLEWFPWMLSPVANNAAHIDDMLEFMSKHVTHECDISFINLYNDVYSKISKDTKWTYDNIIKLLSYSKNFSKKDMCFYDDLFNLLLDIFRSIDEDVIMSSWQDIFHWIGENMPHVYFSKELLEKGSGGLTSACKWNGIHLHTESGKIKVEYDYSYVQKEFDFFVSNYFIVIAKSRNPHDVGVRAKDYVNLKTDKFKSLSEIKSACNLLMDQFFVKHSEDVFVRNKLRNELKVQLYNQDDMHNFIRSIEPGIIKSSNDLRDFIDYVNSINLKKVSANTYGIEYAADLVSNNSLTIDEAKSFLSCFRAKEQWRPSAVLKFYKKIKSGEKWNFIWVHSFLNFLDFSFDLSECYYDEYKKQAEALFGLLNIFCEKKNIAWISNEYDITSKEAVSCIFSLFNNRLQWINLQDLFSKAYKFENGVLLKNNLAQMNLNLTDIDFSRRTSAILTQKTKQEKKINSVFNKLDEKNKNILKNKMAYWLKISKQEKDKEINLAENLKQKQNPQEKKKKTNSVINKLDEQLSIKKPENNESKEENNNIIIKEKGSYNNNNNEIKDKKENKDENNEITENVTITDKNENNPDNNTSILNQNETKNIIIQQKHKIKHNDQEKKKEVNLDENPRQKQEPGQQEPEISQIDSSNVEEKNKYKSPKEITTFNWILFLKLLAVLLIFSAVILVALKFICGITAIWALIVFPVVPIIIFLVCTFVFKNKFRKIYNLNGPEIPTVEDNKKLTQENLQESQIKFENDSLDNPQMSSKD